jgi:hypothetical protein
VRQPVAVAGQLPPIDQELILELLLVHMLAREEHRAERRVVREPLELALLAESRVV